MKFLKIILVVFLLTVQSVQNSLAFPGSDTITAQPNITASPLPTGDPSAYEWPAWREYERQERQNKLSWPNRNEILENYARPRPPEVYQTFEEDENIVVWVCIGVISIVVLCIVAVFFLDLMDRPSKHTYADYRLTENVLRHLNTNVKKYRRKR